MEKCKIDNFPVTIQIFKGTGLCSDLCRKVDTGEITHKEMKVLKREARHRGSRAA